MKLHLLSALALLLCSCATIMNKDVSHISVSTVPAGASFTTNVAGVAGITPTIVSIPNGRDVLFTFDLDGYQPLSVESKATRSAWVAGNFLLGIVGGVVGVLVDLNSDKTLIHKRDITATFPVFDANGIEIVPVAPPKPAPRKRSRYSGATI